jgi:membrane protease YdiL (CAAX protease family)
MEDLLMEKLSEQTKLRPWMGLLLFTVVMALFLFAFTPLQLNLGIPGLIITELGFLVLAVVYCLVRKVKLTEMFPIKKVKVREVIGAVIMVLGMFPISIMLVAITALIFPAATAEIDELSSFIYDSLSFPAAVLLIALMPAVCEEAIHRGAILSHFRGIKHDWVIVLIMGLFFGINHMSVLRFLTTMTLGLFLTYVVVKKNNLLLSMIMHFTNNLISVVLSYAFDQGSTGSASANYTAVLGTYLILGFLSPVLITLGLMLIYPEGHKKIKFLWAGILSVVMLVTGFGINVAVNAQNTLLNSMISYKITEEYQEDSSLYFDVEEDRTATVVVMVANAEGDYTVRIDGDSGSNIINAEIPEGTVRMVTYNVDLRPDHYTVTVIAGDNAIGENPQIQVTVQ